MEAAAGIEPANSGFADRCLNHLATPPPMKLSGGPGLIKAIKAPLPQVELVPVGGVNLDTTADFVRAGAAAVGVGSALVDNKLLELGDFATLTRRAQGFIEEIARGRQAL